MFLTKTKINKLLLVAIAAQKKHESAHPEPYDWNQRVEAVTQRTAQLLGNRTPRLEKEVRRGIETLWTS